MPELNYLRRWSISSSKNEYSTWLLMCWDKFDPFVIDCMKVENVGVVASLCTFSAGRFFQLHFTPRASTVISVIKITFTQNGATFPAVYFNKAPPPKRATSKMRLESKFQIRPSSSHGAPRRRRRRPFEWV